MRITSALAASFVLAACAGPRHATHAAIAPAPANEARASCERTIYDTADYDEPTGLRCAQLLDIWD